MSQRMGFRMLHRAAQQPTFRTTLRQPLSRRNVATADGPVTDAKTSQKTAFAKLWDSPVGPKTVHFWAPIMKWGLVLAGAADFARPAEKLSLTQNFALMCTGTIWTRWCMIIKPKNVFLATVNAFLACVGAIQVTRIVMYNRSVKGESGAEAIKDAASEQAHVVEGVVKDPAGAAKQAQRT